MEELEPPIEQIHEHIHHEAHHSQEMWVTWVALSTALLAALAAVTALLSGYHANTAVIEQVKASDQWAFYQSKSIKATILAGKMDTAKSLGNDASKKDAEKLAKYDKDKKAIQTRAQELSESSGEHFERHEMLARGVTMYQIAISIAAIAVLTKRRWFWYMGLVAGVVGTVFLIYGVTFTPEKEKDESSEAAVIFIDKRVASYPLVKPRPVVAEERGRRGYLCDYQSAARSGTA